MTIESLAGSSTPVVAFARGIDAWNLPTVGERLVPPVSPRLLRRAMCGILSGGMDSRHPATPKSRHPWRRLGRSRQQSSGWMAWLIVVVGGLSAVALAIYGIRNGGFGAGTHSEWIQWKAELSARGEPVFFDAVIPPPLPDYDNFFAAPPFDRLTVDAGPDAPPDLLSIALDPGRGISVAALLAESSDGSGRATLDAIAARLLDAGVTNPRTDYLLPGDRILAGLKELGIDVSPLKEIADRPGSRFPIDYGNLDNPILPHVEALEALSDWLAIQAIARISIGSSEAAMVDLLLIARLADSVASEPFLQSQNARRKLLDVFCGCVMAGLDRGTWNAEELGAFRRVLERARPVADFALALRGERARVNSGVDRLLAGTPPADPTFLGMWLGGVPSELKPRQIRSAQVAVNRAIQSVLDHLYDPPATGPKEEAVPVMLIDLPVPARERLAVLEEEAAAFRQTEKLILATESACTPQVIP